MSEALNFEVPLDWEGLNHVRERIEALLEGYGASPKAAFVSLLVLEEVGTNIIKYAYPVTPPPAGGEDNLSFFLTLVIQERGLTMVFKDHGVPFDPTQEARLEEASLEDSIIGGRGLLLVQRMTKGMRYHRQGESNIFEVDIDLDDT